MQDLLIVLVTASSPEEAETIARALVDERAAACVNIVPGVVSIYAWRGETHRDDETLMIVKTSTPLFEKLRRTVERLHSYEVPEIVSVPLGAVSPKYRSYLEKLLGPAS
jgi:periplasmic divalent cation tolerance protein